MNPKIKFVYVLTSTEKDLYLEEAFVSMYSLKQQMPDAHIVLLTDDRTHATFVGLRKKEVQYADEIICSRFDEKYNAMQRSRLLKTSVRNLIDGDLLFIDTDTIIVKPLYDICKVESDLAFCYNRHITFMKDHYLYDWVSHDMAQIGWNLENVKHYYNSGVFFARDTSEIRSFFGRWKENWLYSFSKGINTDQHSLTQTIKEVGDIIQPLSGVWNTQTIDGLQFFSEAKIIHYYGRREYKENEVPVFMMLDTKYLKQVKATGEIPEEVKRVIREPLSGLANRIVTIAGEDIDFRHSNVYSFFRTRYKKPIYNITSSLISLLSNIKHGPKRLLGLEKKR